MVSFLNYIWTLFLIILCFTGIALCLALIVAFFKSMFGGFDRAEHDAMEELYEEYIDIYKAKRKEGLSHEDANIFAYDYLINKYEVDDIKKSVDNTK